MTAVLEFSPVEFAAMYEALKEEGLPAPLSYRGAPLSYSESQFVKREAWQAVRRRGGAELEQLIEALTRPDIRVIARGVDGREPENPQRALRVLAVRKGDDAFVVRQQPGPTMLDSAGFTVTRHDALSLGGAVAAALRPAEAGRRRDFELVDTSAPDLDFSFSRSLVHDTGEEIPGAGFLAEPEDLTGTIEIEQGWSRFGPRGILRLYLVWRDVVDDGRYVIVPGSPARVVPADRRRLESLINAQIAEVVRAIRDDRA
ncbi:ESX secretion-associated protein EspG [Nocardia rhizosphaerae]|uniref:ESX secretion-associated protein EspG n=1 Tax=Nocardia rhizosphaerae TaxID=1691571 RepID=A0ABV8L2K7_9NOCA